MHFVNEPENYTRMSKNLPIEVAYAIDATRQFLIGIEVEKGATIETAIIRSGILQSFPEIDLTKQKVGIFSKTHHLQDLVKAGDRIEIYRPLLIDPKEARRNKFKAR